MKKFASGGLANVHQERWTFGKGWSLVRFTAHLVEPQIQPLIGFPQEWSSGTKGPVTADVVRVQIASEADFEKYRGKLAGKIVLTQPARERADARRADHPAHGPTRTSRKPRRRRCRRRAAGGGAGQRGRRRSARRFASST